MRAIAGHRGSTSFRDSGSMFSTYENPRPSFAQYVPEQSILRSLQCSISKRLAIFFKICSIYPHCQRETRGRKRTLKDKDEMLDSVTLVKPRLCKGIYNAENVIFRPLSNNLPSIHSNPTAALATKIESFVSHISPNVLAECPRTSKPLYLLP